MFQDGAVAHIGLLGLASLALIVAALSDVVRFRIPNEASLVLLILFPFYVATAPTAIAWEQHLLVFVIVLALGYGMYLKNLAGAGDIKLMACTSLWAGPATLGAFLFITAIAGGLLGLVLAGLTWKRNRSCAPEDVVALRKVPIPYGVAIAIGGLAALLQIAYPFLFPA